jgi:hypothetical protein
MQRGKRYFYRCFLRDGNPIANRSRESMGYGLALDALMSKASRDQRPFLIIENELCEGIAIRRHWESLVPGTRLVGAE